MTDIRIGDADRERAIATLGRHVGDGRLDLGEYTARSDQVTRARTGSELSAVLADLPRLPDPGPRDRARRAAWTVWALTGVICLAIWATVTLAGGGGYFWPIWVIGPWGAVLALGALVPGAAQVSPCTSGRRSG